MLSTDTITEIGINEDGKLFIKPEKSNFRLIWRSATEVHWDSNENYLYSPNLANGLILIGIST